jgi:hypothetical protein
MKFNDKDTSYENATFDDTSMKKVEYYFIFWIRAKNNLGYLTQGTLDFQLHVYVIQVSKNDLYRV